ncbi:MAG: hypothetical protein PUD43_03605, partial [Clostridia bacterium]|nr:hypothetical protein [Clostridia bacterium]
ANAESETQPLAKLSLLCGRAQIAIQRQNRIFIFDFVFGFHFIFGECRKRNAAFGGVELALRFAGTCTTPFFLYLPNYI